MDPDDNVLAVWGSEGAATANLPTDTSLAVDPKTNRVYVADPLHKRIQVVRLERKISLEMDRARMATQYLAIGTRCY